MAVQDSAGNKTKGLNEDLRQRRGWIVTIAVGLALHVLSIVVGLRPAGPLCGSPLLPESRAAEEADAQMHITGLAAECYRNIDAAAMPVWSLMALGIGLVLAGVAVRIVGIRRSIDRNRNLTGPAQS
ncbi:hypothetical protein ACLH0K_08155 [Arthrobacter sp. MPF02]|uniref:hypothetical protein n=1 Tax=Arthrobacter sp. MPF02 TaxID=3388492 RepID=UPI0039847D9E